MDSIQNLSKFPRPDFARNKWRSLDGTWSFAFDPQNNGVREQWYKYPNFTQTIIVPFCVESEASRITRANPPRVLWYAKSFSLASKIKNKRFLLHFGAVDYKATVWLNGILLGSHQGGYTPFHFDITSSVKKKNIIVVRVEDSKRLTQPRGKQTFLHKPFSIFYPGVSGIWQSVWIEAAGEVYVKQFRVVTDINSKTAHFSLLLAGNNKKVTITCQVLAPNGKTIRKDLVAQPYKKNIAFSMKFQTIFPWSTDRPSLYKVTWIIRNAYSLDTVQSYFGFREISARKNRIFLNKKSLYQKLVLVQGYYPQGLYTPLKDEQYREDIALVKKLGFNGIRMHQKIENPKFLFWCDYLGCLVWEEMPSAYRFNSDMQTSLTREWQEILARDQNHPSIIVWVPLNESWGVGAFPLPVILQKRAKKFVKDIFRFTKQADSTRLIVDNSGYDHTSETDIADVHDYLESMKRSDEFYRMLRHPQGIPFTLAGLIKRAFPRKAFMAPFSWGEDYRGQPIIVSEYGGFNFFPKRKKQSMLQYFEQHTGLIRKQPHICGYCYSQLYDTFQEKSGLVTFQRKQKISIAKIRRINT